MDDEGLADHYQVLEELGRKLIVVPSLAMDANNPFTGGSFGVVYKGIEKTTGETVAIKHVSGTSKPFATTADILTANL